MAFDESLIYRRHLPHYQPPGATLFVTFRLYGSLPADVVETLRAKGQRNERILNTLSPEERRHRAYDEQMRMFGRWEAALDAAQESPRWLADDRIARMMVESIRWRDGKVYELLAFCIMPNHVHMVFSTDNPLPVVMQSLKGYTSRQANQILNRKGKFWQDESYDHVIRNEEELERILKYVVNNPVKAGLVDAPEQWPWTYCKFDIL
jgi:REP element-mobilizing transposase RayT